MQNESLIKSAQNTLCHVGHVYPWQAMVSVDVFGESVLNFVNHLPNGPSLLLRAALSWVLKALKGPVPDTTRDHQAVHCIRSSVFVSKFESKNGVQYPLLSVCRIFLQFLVGSQPVCFAPAGSSAVPNAASPKVPNRSDAIGDRRHSRADLLFFGKSSGSCDSCVALSEVPRDHAVNPN